MTRKAADHYFDSSVLLRYAIRHTGAISDLGPFLHGSSSSVLTKVECMRVLDRWRLTREVSDALLAEARSRCLKLLSGLRLIELDGAIVELASQTFPLALKSLDALHLATALRMQQALGREVAILTHDQRLSLAAQSLGMAVVGS